MRLTSRLPRAALAGFAAVATLTVLAKPSPAPMPFVQGSSLLGSGSTGAASAYVAVRNATRAGCTVTVLLQGGVPNATSGLFTLQTLASTVPITLAPQQAVKVGVSDPDILPAGMIFQASLTTTCASSADANPEAKVPASLVVTERDSGRPLLAQRLQR